MKTKNSNPILITGGHMSPALAVLSELKKRGYTNFIWVGHKYNQRRDKSFSPEYRSITTLRIPFIELRSGKLIREFGFKDIPYFLNQLRLIPLGFIKSILIIKKYRPRMILSFGGYLALPIAFASWLFKIPVITHEQTIVSGLANKLIGRFSNKVLISWESSKKYFNPKKVVLTGNPIRREIFNSKLENVTKDLDKNLETVLIYGGNQGSQIINSVIFSILPELLGQYNVIHQTGSSTATGDYQNALKLKTGLSLDLKNRYLPKDYITSNEVGEILSKANLIIGRAGANSISEYLALGKTSILIPIPWSSSDEQMKNARLVKSVGLAEIIEQKDLSETKLLKLIETSFENLHKGLDFLNRDLDSAIVEGRNLINLDAHKSIVDIIEEYYS